MLTMLKTAALSALIGLGAIASMPAAAQAEGIYLGFGDRHDGARVGVYLGGERADYRGHDWRRDRRDRGRDEFRGCSPDRALNKAERMGLHRARVVDVDRRTIRVSGRKFGDRVTVTFGRAPNCPIVRW